MAAKVATKFKRKIKILSFEFKIELKSLRTLHGKCGKKCFYLDYVQLIYCRSVSMGFLQRVFFFFFFFFFSVNEPCKLGSIEHLSWV